MALNTSAHYPHDGEPAATGIHVGDAKPRGESDDGSNWRSVDAELLHYEAKRALKLGKHLYTPSGREIFKPASTADRAMDESERARGG